MRGEHALNACFEKRPGGSSPHARGARAGRRADGRLDGIIPACAGSTSALSLTAVSRRDHPRMRGEHRAGTKTASAGRGSSPHARGAHGE